MNELTQKPSRHFSKHGVIANRVEVELSPQCHDPFSSNRELSSNFNMHDIEAIEELLHSSGYEDDPETLRTMQDRIFQIRQKH